MSRISKNPVLIPNDVEVNLSDGEITVNGPQGSLNQKIIPEVHLSHEDNKIHVHQKKDTKHVHAMSGTIRSLIANMVHGVSKGFEKKLQLVGVGYRAQLSGNNLQLNLGYSHLIDYQIPEGLKVEIPVQTEIVIKGIDKQRIGQMAAEIRALRKPEPYKGKGVRYADETIILKEAKKK